MSDSVGGSDNLENWHHGDWMQTFTGKKFYPLSPRPEDICIEDIAHALSMLCRFNGHVDRFYSVAEHCILMSETFGDKQLALEALLHDASETYLGDMIRPLKVNMPEYRRAEQAVEVAIAERFGLPTVKFSNDLVAFYAMPSEVKEADSRILLTERNALMTGKSPAAWVQDGKVSPLPVDIDGWMPAGAEARYLTRFKELTK